MNLRGSVNLNAAETLKWGSDFRQTIQPIHWSQGRLGNLSLQMMDSTA
jgi:hypothetical protein